MSPAATATSRRGPDDDAEVLLDETMAYAPAVGSDSQTQADSIHMALVAGPGQSQTTETTSLLHERLLATAWALALIYLIVIPWSLFVREGMHWAVTVSLLLRLALVGGVVALLRSTWKASEARLRLVEVVMFGGLTVLVCIGAYYGNLAYIHQHDIAKVVGNEKNGILQMFVLMLLYGVLIPNDPRRTARMVVTMALGPLLVFSVLLDRPLEVEAHVSDWETLVIAGTNALYLSIGAGLAIYVAHLLQGLRRELRDAKRLGQYHLGEKLGSGGMGEVYLAEHQLLKRPVALKRIRADVRADATTLARFEREVQAAAVLSHPSTIAIYDYGHAEDGTFYYVMECLTGLASNDLIQQFGPMPPGRAVYLMRQICGALAEAHRLGIVHRDLKPANIFVSILGGQCDVAKVLDFGLVKITLPGATDLTAENSVSGTPLYMSPEQAVGDRDYDHRIDIYSLGGILYYWLTGRPPFEGQTATAVMIAHARDAVTPPSKHRAEIPADLEAIILKCLAKKAEERFADARELEKALAGCACAGEWDAARAEAWWAAQASALQGKGGGSDPVGAVAGALPAGG
jgi:serine/threonine-protein kinase